ncbi:MAG: hypothetical protein DMD82_02570 [Candidatus Rokuibacteriota bacterium]|nr:MAG: hypothetical protein DMD82_02570 [Candidatus Rokubacteria bacterium]
MRERTGSGLVSAEAIATVAGHERHHVATKAIIHRRSHADDLCAGVEGDPPGEVPLMSRWAKAALVCAGYVLALIAGGVASHMYNARVSALPFDTSGGMYAAGELLSALGAFLVVALVPTALGLWFLRRNGTLWRWIGFTALGFASAGLVAVLLPLMIHTPPRDPVLMAFSLLGLAQLLGVPLWTLALVLFALIAPTRPARRLLGAAIGIELVIGACAAVHWFAPSPPL